MNKEGNWEVTVRKVNNGFICKYEEETEDGEGFYTSEVLFELKDTEDGELENMKELLYWIKEHFGIYWSKHNKTNLDIELNKEKDHK